MPATIDDILRTKPELITTTPEAFLFDALEQMLRYDYSQLPVIDPTGKPVGMLSSDSALRALHHFGVVVREPKKEADKARQLRVRDAMYDQVEICSPEHEVFAVHRQLRDVSGVLVVDDVGKLIGIITGFDTTEYLRQRVQDIVFVQDIEARLKDYIRLAFRQPDGAEDIDALNEAVAQVSRSGTPSAKATKDILVQYLSQHGNGVALNEQVFDQLLLQTLGGKQPPDIDKLTLGTYIQLFTKYGLTRYGHVFQIDAKAIGQMLDSVRETRNDLAHLRIDITARQRDELRLCRQWLKHYADAIRAAVSPQIAGSAELVEVSDTLQASGSVVSAQSADGVTATDVSAPDEARLPSNGRYGPLGDWLYGLAPDQDRIPLSFGQIEQIIGGQLPPSAREYRSWWANETSRQRQSEQWLSAGWRTEDVDFGRGRVTFVRILEREKAYNSFFKALLDDLKRIGAFPLFPPTRVGYYWQSITKVPAKAPFAGYTTFSFTRARRPRVDLYIDTSDKARNKLIFDRLKERQAEIEQAYGGPLEWERIEEKRASRIAVYYDTSVTINSPQEELDDLRGWGIDALVRIYHALEQPTLEVISSLGDSREAPTSA